MKHLQPNGRGTGYSWCSGVTGEVVEIEIRYDKGGMNYFSGGKKARGVYAYITPVSICATEHGAVKSFVMFSGVGALVAELARKSDKITAQLAERIDERVPEAAAIFAQNPRAAVRFLVDGTRTEAV